MSILREVSARLGAPPRGWASVFPLSPSVVKWDWQGDGGPCALRHILKSCYGWVARPGEHVYRGRLVDAVVTQHMRLKLGIGEGLSVHEARSFLYDAHATLSKDYNLSAVDERSFLRKIEGSLLNVWPQLAAINPVTAQERHWLWIGDSPIPPTPEASRRLDPNWVTGFSDWTTKMADGLRVVDLKVKSKFLSEMNRQYHIQLGTYARAIEQDGRRVCEIALSQFGWQTASIDDSCVWLWTDRQGDRVVSIFRAVRDHYVAALAGRAELLIPILGNGGCTQRGCDFYASCPFGEGKPWTGKVRDRGLEV